MTTSSVLQNDKRTVFAAVPEKGPVALLFALGSPTLIYEALRELRPKLDELRPGRANHPIVFGLTTDAFESMQGVHLSVLTKALGVSGFTASGILADSPNAEQLSEKTDLMLLPGPAGGSFEELAFQRICAEEAFSRQQEAQHWEEALVLDAEFNAREVAQVWDLAQEENVAFDVRREQERLERARLLAEEAAAWDEALVENERLDNERLVADWTEALVENELFDRRQEAVAWDEALAENARFEARQEAIRREQAQRLLEEEAAAWTEALADNVAFDEARRTELANAWDEAAIENERRNRAEDMARRVREAVMRGEAIDVFGTVSQGASPDESQADSFSPLPTTPVAAVGQAAPSLADVAVAEADIATETDVSVGTKTLVHTGRVRSGSRIYAENRDLMLFGSLSSGAEAISDGNVHIYGPVHGRIIAGASGDLTAHVVCQKFHGELVSIGGRYSSFEKLDKDLLGKPVHFWVENDGLHFRRLDLND